MFYFKFSMTSSELPFPHDESSFLSSYNSLRTSDELQTSNLLPNSTSTLPKDIKPELKNNYFKNSKHLFEISNLLSNNECNLILKNLKSLKSKNISYSNLKDNLRNNNRYLLKDINLSNIIFKRLSKYLLNNNNIKKFNIDLTPLGFGVTNKNIHNKWNLQA